MTGITYDKERVHFNLAKLKVGGHNFEIDIDPDKAIAFKEGKNIGIRDILKAQKIFSDAKKGLVASEHVMQQVFHTTDPLQIAKVIIEKGNIQLSKEYRERQMQLKKKKIIEIIHTNAVDPKTHLPHPRHRIENAMEEAKIKIDEHKKAEDQVKDVVKKLRSVLPIRFELKDIEIRIPSAYAMKSYSVIKRFGNIIKEEWMQDGGWLVVIEVPGGLEEEFYDNLNSITHGNNEVRVIATKQ